MARKPAERVPTPDLLDHPDVARLWRGITPEWMRVLGQTWFWALYLEARRLARKGNKDSAVVLLMAEAGWRAWHLGLRGSLAFPGIVGRPPPVESRAVHVVVLWLAGQVELPGLGRAEESLRPGAIAAFARRAARERLGGTDAWAAVNTAAKVRVCLSRHRDREDVQVALRPDDVPVPQSGFLNAPPQLRNA
jgi:hypothetical protein